MMRNSLTLRLVATSFAWVGATLLVTAVLLVVLFRGHIEQHFEALLLDHLEELVSATEMTPEGTLQMNILGVPGWVLASPETSRVLTGRPDAAQPIRGRAVRQADLAAMNMLILVTLTLLTGPA